MKLFIMCGIHILPKQFSDHKKLILVAHIRDEIIHSEVESAIIMATYYPNEATI